MRATPLFQFALGLALTVVANAASTVACAAAPRYIGTPIGSLGGTYSWALGINRHGTVTGSAADSNEWPRAFINVDWVMKPLSAAMASRSSYGRAISDNGYVAGHLIDETNRERAFLDDGHGTIDLGTLGGGWSYALGVNDAREIVGVSVTSLDPSSRAFLYRNGAMINLGTLGGSYSVANGINGSGQITGVAGVTAGPGHAFLYANGVMTDLGTLGGELSVGVAINARGQVTGYSDIAAPPSVAPGAPTERAFLHVGGHMVDLGTLGGVFSRGRSINLAGDVVGEAQDNYGRQRAFLYTGGRMYDLNDLTVTWPEGVIPPLTEARGINDAGQIAASWCRGGAPNSCRAYRLDPVLTAVEYFHAGFGHYFITTSPSEIAALDADSENGWNRTGLSFATFPLDLPHVARVCRFWSGQRFAPKSSHFYTPWASECEKVKANPDWQFEGEVFGMWLPLSYGGCEPGTVPVYRLYNGGNGGAPNHRYTTSRMISSMMIARGWIPEGTGAAGVSGCVPEP